LPSVVKNLSPVLLELSVTVPAAEIDRAFETALTTVAREARLPGFRRGKVPRSVARRMFGRALLADLRGDLVAKASAEAIEEHGIEPVSEPEFSAEGIEELIGGQDFRFTLQVATAPRLERVNFDDVEIRRHQLELPADLVERELESIRSRLATAADPEEPRPARVGDLVHVEIERWIDGEWKGSASPENRLVLDPGEIREEFVEALTGGLPGDVREIELSHPGDDGESLRLRMKVVGVQERHLPELDDELARDTGEFETLEELKADIERQARETAKVEERRRLRQDLFEALRRANPMELPAALVRKQAAAMQREVKGLGGLDDGAEGDVEEPVHETLAAGIEQAARELVHTHFLNRELARLHGIEVSAEEVEAGIERMATGSGLPVPLLRAQLSKLGRLDEFESRLLEDKVVDFALARVRVLESAAPPDENPDGKE